MRYDLLFPVDSYTSLPYFDHTSGSCSRPNWQRGWSQVGRTGFETRDLVMPRGCFVFHRVSLFWSLGGRFSQSYCAEVAVK